ncbi:MAG: hypothetical protein QME51_04235, partial [Planctomycetota bacterium]|nr:hypothetical protein [Planctomycetota bacterium]
MTLISKLNTNSLVSRLRPKIEDVVRELEQRKQPQVSTIKEEVPLPVLGRPLTNFTLDDISALSRADNEAINLYQTSLQELEKARDTPDFNPDKYHKLIKLRQFKSNRLSIIEDIAKGERNIDEIQGLTKPDFDEDTRLLSEIRTKAIKPIQVPTIELEQPRTTTRVEPIRVTSEGIEKALTPEPPRPTKEELEKHKQEALRELPVFIPTDKFDPSKGYRTTYGEAYKVLLTPQQGQSIERQVRDVELGHYPIGTLKGIGKIV